MFVSRTIITSTAFLSLRAQGAPQVFLVFLGKCRYERIQGKTAKRKADHVHVNSGELRFSYREAKEEYGIPAQRFTRIIDELVSVGLLDIAHSGVGLHKDVTLYGVSDRWRAYGTAEFVAAERPKRKLSIGFARSPTYIHNTVTQVRCIIDKCGFHFWPDLTRVAVETCLGRLDVASKTFNAYQASIKLFGEWMVENGRADISPVQRIKPVRWTKTEERRAMTTDEATALLRATPLQPTRSGMTAIERTVLYLTALETGYRMNELRCLTAGCFDPDGPSINLTAQYTKNRMEATQLIKRCRVAQYRGFLAGTSREDRMFAMPGDNEVLDAFRADLKAAGVKPVDRRGVKVTFHSLRYGLATALDKSGATLKERMTVLRHSTTGNLTLGVYTTVEVVDLRSR